jgi:hypothetical protein
MTPKIFIASPMYGGLCSGLYTIGMISVSNVLNGAGIPFSYNTLMTESLITRARNLLAHTFLSTNFSHLMFIDADIGFTATDIISMINADKDIICGIYPKKEINWPLVEAAVKQGVPASGLANFTGSFVVNLANGAQEETFHIDKPLEIENGGTGFMVVKREVFEALSESVPRYSHDMYRPEDSEQKPMLIHEFFATSIDEKSNRLLSEDYHFCKIARKQGFKVWAAPWVRLVHCGAYNFSGMIPRL